MHSAGRGFVIPCEKRPITKSSVQTRSLQTAQEGKQKWPLGNVREQAVDGLLQEMRADSYAVKTDTPDCHQMFFSASYVSCDDGAPEMQRLWPNTGFGNNGGN